MSMNQITLSLAFVAGLVSFLSPCVLPIIPGFLVYLAGTSADQAKPNRLRIFLSALCFVLGFSIVFSLFGVLLNSVLVHVAYSVQLWLARIGGLVIIFFGLFLTGLIHIPYLERNHQVLVKKKFQSHYITSFVFGAAFAAGWTPCVGAVLGSILALSVTAPGSAFILLFWYSLGLGVPFLLVGLFTTQLSALFARSSRIVRGIHIVFGILLIVIGVFAFTEQLGLLANFQLLNSILLR